MEGGPREIKNLWGVLNVPKPLDFSDSDLDSEPTTEATRGRKGFFQ